MINKIDEQILLYANGKISLASLCRITYSIGYISSKDEIREVKKDTINTYYNNEK